MISEKKKQKFSSEKAGQRDGIESDGEMSFSAHAGRDSERGVVQYFGRSNASLGRRHRVESAERFSLSEWFSGNFRLPGSAGIV
jgi:hypothetical protein